MAKTVTYRFEDETVELIDLLAGALSLSKTDVLRRAVSALRDQLVTARADALATLEVIRERHPDAAELTIDVSRGADGEPEATVRIDGDEHADVGARVAIAGDTALVFLVIPDGTAHVLVSAGSEDLLVRPQFPVAWLPWPPQNLRTVLDLKEPAAAVSEAMLALVKA